MNTLEFAIKMELDGEKYYTEQAEINKNNSLQAVCLLLAEDERHHAEILQNKLAALSYELKDRDTLSAAKNIFEGISNFKNELKGIPSQLDFYAMALEKEKQSIQLYEGFLSEAADDQEKKLYQYLIKQEEYHRAILDALVTMISHADEWVESAEFGIRKEY